MVINIFLTILFLYSPNLTARPATYSSFMANNLMSYSQNKFSEKLLSACNKKCSSYKSVEVCFISKDIIQSINYSKSPGACQGAEIIKYIDDSQEITTGLTEIANDCKKVTKLILHGHGDKDSIKMGSHVSAYDWPNIALNFSCVLSDNVDIDLRSCNVGNGCDGQIQMYRIAKSFLVDKIGTITAPTNFAVTDKLAITKVRSINGKDRTLKYDGKTGSVIWGYDGLLLTGWKTATNTCLDEVKELINRVKFFEKKLKQYACSMSENMDSVFELRNAALEFESKIKNNSPPNNILNFLPTKESTVDSYKFRLEKIGINAISACLKDNYRKKLSKSSRSEDQEYLKQLDSQAENNTKFISNSIETSK